MKPTVLLFSEPNALALNIIESLLVNFCRVKIFSNDLGNWKKLTEHIVTSDHMEFIRRDKFNNEKICDYIICVDFYPESLNKSVDFINRLSADLKAKAFFITSAINLSNIYSHKPDFTNQVTVPNFHSVGVVYVGDLIGPRMNFDKRNRTSEIINAALNSKNIKIERSEKIYPVLLGDVAKLISKWLFSFGPFGEETILFSQGILAEDFCKLIQRFRSDFNCTVTNEVIGSENFGKMRVTPIETNYPKSLELIFNWFAATKKVPAIKKVRENKVKAQLKQKDSIKVNRILIGLFVVGLILISAPAIMSASAFSLYLSKAAILKGDFVSTERFLNISKSISSAAYKESVFLSNIPIVGGLYEPVANLSYVIKNTSLIGTTAVDMMRTASELSEKILGQSAYDIYAYSGKISSDLEYIAKTISFTEGELKLYPSLYKEIDIEKLKIFVEESKKIVSELPETLGAGAKKTYLVLFQNNMELRPGGGFIGSFALVSVEDGRLTDISISDVYSADGQLRGHVEPPGPIKKYLGEANWFLRDSNWDVDFAKNAQKAEWFLDKEIDVAVDGVVAIDLFVARDLLAQIGPIYLKDYGAEINADNLYEKTQSEVEENFFPGSVKKASFLTALSKEILTEITDGSAQKLPNFAKVIYRNLTGKHIQIFLHNPTVQAAFTTLNWDGSFLPKQFGLVEANLGVNKANYFLKRNYYLDISQQDWNLKIVYENTANPAIGNKGIYKTYLRLVTPNVATGVVANGYDLDVSEISGRRENGLYFEVLPGEKKEINLSWQMPHEGELNWRKQPGTGEDNVTLTVGGKIIYNSTFLNDIIWSSTY